MFIFALLLFFQSVLLLTWIIKKILPNEKQFTFYSEKIGMQSFFDMEFWETDSRFST